jgi:hypothetical protein
MPTQGYAYNNEHLSPNHGYAYFHSQHPQVDFRLELEWARVDAIGKIQRLPSLLPHTSNFIRLLLACI